MDAEKLIGSQRVHLGKKPDSLTSGRVAEAKRLTTLMSESQAFSFVRLGDKDLAFLLYPQEVAQTYGGTPQQINGTQPHGTPGLAEGQEARLRRALERASYVDFWECQWRDNSWLDRLNLKRPPNSYRNPSRETSYILGTWLEYEFKTYCNGRRILFCGAEAPLLEALLRQAAFHDCCKAFWPDNCAAFFVRPRNNGKNLGSDIDLVKRDLAEAISRHKIDTLFLSLGGAAKIICQELADEMNIRAFDFGVGLRSLTYSGSGGYMAARGTHLIFLYRVPFGLYMDALEEAFPNLTPEEKLAKAHAQLLLEVQEKEVGWSHSACEYDFSEENTQAFQAGFVEYKKRYSPLFLHSAITIEERNDFMHFCGTHKLTAEGRRFLRWFNAKGWIKSRLKSLRSPYIGRGDAWQRPKLRR